MTKYQQIQIERQDGQAVVVVARPEKLNALNAATIDELREAFQELATDDDIRGIIVTGAGEKAFVAGADIGELAKMNALSAIETSRRGQDAFRFIERLSKPVVAAVNGYALGGGLELALGCHLRIAADNARFGLPEVTLGIIPGYGGTVRLPRLVGRGRALQMILTGAMVDANEALRIGLVNQVVPREELLNTTRDLLGKILKNGPVAVAKALEAVDRSYDHTMEDALALEANLFGILAATEDMKEGMNAFLEKREARFTGR
ncbi:MAG: enoyl-CoA hydratase-related protein [Gemmatimonadota bacterium]|jgi:enoyl-CoA hydratase